MNAGRLLMVLASTFGNCYATQRVIDENETLSDSIYEILTKSLVNNCGREVVKLLLIMQQRTQQPCTLSLAFFGPLRITTFKAILSNAYSYYSLIRAKASNF